MTARRNIIRTLATGVLLMLLPCQSFCQNGRFQLITLPYSTDALAPVISKETMELHHGKHLLAYVTNLNAAIVGTEFETMPLEEIVKKSSGGIFNNAGQLLNHNLYFTQFSPNARTKPTGTLLAAIEKKWGSFEAFQKEFVSKGGSLFGSGWVWLSKDKDGNLHITQETNGSNPVVRDLIPLMGIDVWEHAYYLDYKNKRADHLNNVWKIIDWNVVEKRYSL